MIDTMEIHAPHERVHSFKDFAVHISIVTIGILIALSLEGLRELVRDHKVVREARENILLELKLNQGQLAQELPAVKKASQEIKDLVADLPNLAQQTDLLNKRLAAIRNPGYFFKFHSWQTALSSGALAHMETEEVAQYSAAEFEINEYSSLQVEARNAQDRVLTYFSAHPNPTPVELREGAERLLLWSSAERNLVQIANELEGDLKAAYSRAIGMPMPKVDER